MTKIVVSSFIFLGILIYPSIGSIKYRSGLSISIKLINTSPTRYQKFHRNRYMAVRLCNNGRSPELARPVWDAPSYFLQFILLDLNGKEMLNMGPRVNYVLLPKKVKLFPKECFTAIENIREEFGELSEGCYEGHVEYYENNDLKNDIPLKSNKISICFSKEDFFPNRRDYESVDPLKFPRPKLHPNPKTPNPQNDTKTP